MKYVFWVLILVGIGSLIFTLTGTSQIPETYSQQIQKKDGLIQIGLHQTVTYEDLKLTLTKVEDSRCPSDVTCVWEGQAKVTLQVFQGLNEHRVTFVTGERKLDTIGQYKINFIDILPYPTSATGNFEKDYNAKISIIKEEKNLISSTFPLQQIKNGIPIMDVTCSQEKIKVYKNNLLRLACVSQEIADRLVERGWGLPKEIQDQLDESSLAPGVFVRPQYDNTNFDVQPKIINGQKLLVMQGDNWSLSKDIEITIQSDSAKVNTIKTRTNNDGQFYLSWAIPDDFQSGQYSVQITDGIKNKTENVTVLGITKEIRHLGPGYQVIVEGDKEVRRGTTHNIEVSVYKDQIPVQGARVFLDIEDYGEDRIREFEGWTDPNGKFVYSWEIPKSFDDIETLLAFIGVVHGDFSRTELFKFVVYCLPGEEGCQVEGN